LDRVLIFPVTMTTPKRVSRTPETMLMGRRYGFSLPNNFRSPKPARRNGIPRPSE
jgi:hypothetical protein